MSLSAAYHASLFLKTNPTKEQIEEKIESLHKANEWAERNMSPGMDGSARTIHMNGTEIRMCREHLAHVFGVEFTGYRCPMATSEYRRLMGSN